VENIKAIIEWSTARNVDEVRSFMGLVVITGSLLGTSHGLAIKLHICRGKGRSLNGMRSV